MNCSASEWAFEQFLQEASPADASSGSSAANRNVVAGEIKSQNKQQQKQNKTQNLNLDGKSHKTTTALFTGAGNDTVLFSAAAAADAAVHPFPIDPVDSEEYRALLKSKLNLACAAVALSRASLLKPQDSAGRSDSGSQASDTSQLGSQAPSKGTGYDLSRSQDKDANGPIGLPSLPAMQKKAGALVRPTTSGSSRDLSEDDELEGDTETTENMDPAESKRVRRKLSNRESARRSRRRKQAHLTEIETQVSQLRVEHSSVLKRRTDIGQKYNETAVDNRVLKAEIETLRAKVKMAEETVKRITGLNSLFHVMPDIPTMAMPSFDGNPPDTSADVAVPVQDDPKHHFYQPLSNNSIASHDPREDKCY